MEVFAHGGIHGLHKDGYGHLQPKRHDLPLKVGPKARFPSDSFADADLVVCLGKVELREPLSAARLIQQHVDMMCGRSSIRSVKMAFKPLQ